MKPSVYQQRIFDFVQNEKKSCIIEAVAGSGKTTTIVKCADMLPKNEATLFCAFNKSIADELKTKLPDNVRAMTLNGLGHRALMALFGKAPQLDTSKIYNILNSPEFESEFGLWTIRKLKGNVMKLVGYAKSIGLVPAGVNAHGLVEDTNEVWQAIIEHHDIDFTQKDNGNMSNNRLAMKEQEAEETAIEMARECLTQSLKDWNTIDFNDQLYMSVVFNAPFPQYDNVFVDESQDISRIQRVMLRRALKPEGRLIAVGDPHQAIYGFRGADSESLNNIAREFKCERLPLSISYRCPQSVVKLAQTYVPHIEAREGAVQGTIEEMGYLENRIKDLTPQDLILCRNTAPLIRAAFKLIANQVAATVLGREIGKGLVQLINKLNADNMAYLEERLFEWRERQVARKLRKDPDADISLIDEKVECIMIFIESTKPRSVQALVSSIENLFGQTNKLGAVTLSTVHKAKGLEAERVIILDSYLMPSKYATKRWQKVQEDNLIYVAITRSKSYLGYLSSAKPSWETGNA